MPLKLLTTEYNGPELAAKLRENWLSGFATDKSERVLCASLEIIRWLASLLAESGLPLPNCSPSDIPLHLVLADIPDLQAADDKAKLMIRNAIRDSIHVLDYDQDLFCTLEGDYMIHKFWSLPNNLIYNSMEWRAVDDIVFPRYGYIHQIAKKGLFHGIKDPEDLARTVEERLNAHEENGGTTHHIQNPPTFIRFEWKRDENRGALCPGDFSMFDVEIRDAYVEDKLLTHSIVRASYRLVCIAKRWNKDEKPIAAHFYMSDGRSFFPQDDGELSQYWSCDNSGEYYLVYQKSDETRDSRPRSPDLSHRIQHPKSISGGEDEASNDSDDPSHQDTSRSSSPSLQLATRPKAQTRISLRHHPYRYSL
ncbi:hypothetical protein F5Y04DRAFT_279534 [Hypomontagnella monticulosa]|nr:hypothetical protein F5Y04DRAFT_279534 [Hypomontagnella monticulosa]